ncbi:MAG: DNA polymerase III subunit delta [Actinomycetota bacterium]|nr:DNA polymerase III subunit delta [Actinomycetota bacterium]
MADASSTTVPAPDQVLGRVTVVTGPEEFLGERAVGAFRAAVRSHDGEAEFSETSADQLSMATLGELSAPSLFSTTRCVVVRRFEDLPEESVEGILRYAEAPAEDVALVLVHSGGQKGSGVLTRLRKAAGVAEVKTAPLSAREYPGFVVNELRAHRMRVDNDAASFLVQAVGQDLRALSAACSQLANDFAAQPGTAGSIGTEMVKQYFGGRAEAKSFTVADHTLFGRTAKALEELRWALDRGTAPVLVTSAMATSLRSLAKYASAGRGRPADLMREIGVPGWKLDVLREQARGWDHTGIAQAIRVVARADADVKGQASDAAYALERMVLAVVRLRTGR